MKKPNFSLSRNTRPWRKNSIVLAFVVLPLMVISQHLELEQARQLAISQKHQAAETALAKLTEAYPDFMPAKLLQAHNHSWQQQFGRAIQEFKAILKIDPTNEDALIGLGYAYAWSGDTPKAIYTFQKVLQKNGSNEEARKGLGHVYLIAGDGEAAVLIFQSLIDDFPNKIDYFIGIGQTHLLLGQSKRARKSLQKALAIDPSNQKAQDLFNRIRTVNSNFEVDVWGGYSKVGTESLYGLRLLQASWHLAPSFTTYVKYDNTLSLDNIDFVLRRQGAASAWIGAVAGWNEQLSSRLEYGQRFFPERNTQHLFKAEQVFYTESAVNFKLGGFAGFAPDTPAEWFINTGVYVPLGSVFSFETSYFYSRDGNSDQAQHRGLLSAKLRHPKGYEMTVGGFYGKPNLNTEFIPGAEDRIAGAFLVGLFPFSKMVWGQLAINREYGVFDESTVFAAGIKIRMEK